MSQIVETQISRTKEASFAKKFDRFLAQLRDSNQATIEIRKEIDLLKKANDRSYARAKKAVDALSR
jgi:hypothetical protein